jgi:hypothetical protein
MTKSEVRSHVVLFVGLIFFVATIVFPPLETLIAIVFTVVSLIVVTYICLGFLGKEWLIATRYWINKIKNADNN